MRLRKIDAGPRSEGASDGIILNGETKLLVYGQMIVKKTPRTRAFIM